MRFSGNIPNSDVFHLMWWQSTQFVFLLYEVTHLIGCSSKKNTGKERRCSTMTPQRVKEAYNVPCISADAILECAIVCTLPWE